MKRLILAALSAIVAAVMFAGGAAPANAQAYDLLIYGGTVIDPSQNLNAVRDVAIKNGLVALVAANIDHAQATTLYDATGKTVTPGLINLHVHAASTVWPQTLLGTNVDAAAKLDGATTVVSAGDAGANNAAAFKTSMAGLTTRVYGLLNISQLGMAVPYTATEIPNIGVCDSCAAAAALATNPNFYIGLKVRTTFDVVGNLDLAPVQKAIDAATLATTLTGGRKFVVMVHIGGLRTQQLITDLLNMLRPGDMLTHAFSNVVNPQFPSTPVGIAQNGVCLPAVATALARGVLLDTGSGVQPNYSSTDPYVYGVCAKTGIRPTTISSDRYLLASGLYTLPDLASLFLAMNNNNVTPAYAGANGPIMTPLTLSDVIGMMTIAPAAIIGDRGPPLLGTLQVGAPGDVAILSIQQPGPFTFSVWGPGGTATLTGTTKLNVVQTIKAGIPQ